MQPKEQRAMDMVLVVHKRDAPRPSDRSAAPTDHTTIRAGFRPSGSDQIGESPSNRGTADAELLLKLPFARKERSYGEIPALNSSSQTIGDLLESVPSLATHMFRIAQFVWLDDTNCIFNHAEF